MSKKIATVLSQAGMSKVRAMSGSDPCRPAPSVQLHCASIDHHEVPDIFAFRILPDYVLNLLQALISGRPNGLRRPTRQPAILWRLLLGAFLCGPTVSWAQSLDAPVTQLPPARVGMLCPAISSEAAKTVV